MSRHYGESGFLQDCSRIGFGFGGTGALYYALSGEMADWAVNAIASFHGELDHVVANATVDVMGMEQWDNWRWAVI